MKMRKVIHLIGLLCFEVGMTGWRQDFHNIRAVKRAYQPENRVELGKMLEQVILPKKGRLTLTEREVENSGAFMRLRRRHSGVESAINGLENHGLDRCLDHGFFGFKRYVALAVLARNIQRLGHIIQEKELKRQMWRGKTKLCWRSITTLNPLSLLFCPPIV